MSVKMRRSARSWRPESWAESSEQSRRRLEPARRHHRARSHAAGLRADRVRHCGSKRMHDDERDEKLAIEPTTTMDAMGAPVDSAPVGEGRIAGRVAALDVEHQAPPPF